MWLLHCLSYILEIIFDIFSCGIHIYQKVCYIYLQIISRTNEPHHLHCYHSNSSYCHVSPVTATASSQVSVLSLAHAVCCQDSIEHDLLTLEVRLCIFSVQNSAMAPPSSLRAVTRLLIVAHLALHDPVLRTPLTSSLPTLVLAHFARATLASMLFPKHARLAGPSEFCLFLPVRMYLPQVSVWLIPLPLSSHRLIVIFQFYANCCLRN